MNMREPAGPVPGLGPGRAWQLAPGWLLVAGLGLLGPAAAAQTVTVDITPGHEVNLFSPLRALGAGVDRDPPDSTATLFAPADVARMRSAGWGNLSYRLNTELSIQAWHWNPQGQWSDAAAQQGYFVGQAEPDGVLQRSFGYNLPHRGTTSNYGTSGGYSMLDDGDAKTYWKSNPYLDRVYTGESNTLHPAWVVVDLGRTAGVDALRIDWGDPYATAYRVQYWTGDDAIGNPAGGQWQDFAHGVVARGGGGVARLQVAAQPVSVRFVRVWMTTSSGTCDDHGAADPRNCLGFAIRELSIGSGRGRHFVDLVDHRADADQTATYASSVDPWHSTAHVAKYDGEQPGFDRLYRSGLTRGLPMTVPVAMLYDNPDNAAAQIAWLQRRGDAIRYVELGEEPDGQFVTPEDDAALFIQWADAIHRVDPAAVLAGPVFEGTNTDIATWPDAQGQTSWFRRFLQYLDSHGHLADLGVMTFEHYPFEPCRIVWDDLFREPALVRDIMKVWRDDGLPPGVPMQITESNLSYQATDQFMQPFGALWLADFAGSFLSAGGQALYYYQDEPLPKYRNCGGWGTFGMFNVNADYRVLQVTAQYFAARLLTQQWAQPVDLPHRLVPAQGSLTDGQGHAIVTAYALQRPDGQWALLLVNKDPGQAHAITVTFRDRSGPAQHFAGPVAQIGFGADDYVWHVDGARGEADPDGPLTRTQAAGGAGAVYLLPAASVTVLRGRLDGDAAGR